MKPFIRTLALVIALVLPAAAHAADKLRVACVGDSITFGACVEEREKNCYPVVLGNLLGEGYDVRNFGVNGATLLKNGDLPYWKLGAFKDATAFNPDVVIIKLGSNDTKPQNWKHKDDFAADYKALIQHFKALPSKPKVFISLPVPALKDNFGINEKAVLEQQPIIRKVAEEEGVTLIDFHATINKAEQFDKDGIHPNAEGAKAIAEQVAPIVKAAKKD